MEYSHLVSSAGREESQTKSYRTAKDHATSLQDKHGSSYPYLVQELSQKTTRTLPASFDIFARCATPCCHNLT